MTACPLCQRPPRKGRFDYLCDACVVAVHRHRPARLERLMLALRRALHAERVPRPIAAELEDAIRRIIAEHAETP